TVPAESVRQANSTALAILKTYPWPLRSVRVLLTADYDRLLDGVDLPPLLSVQEAADRLGISRQAVIKAISTQRLPAIRVGGTWIVRGSSVRALSQRSV